VSAKSRAPSQTIEESDVLKGQRETRRSFSFAFLTPSFGLVEAASSQRCTCIIVIACLAAGSLTSMSSTVAGSDMLDPRVAPEYTNAENCRLEERFGLHLDGVPDAAHVSERDGADPQRHGLNRSIFAFYSP
jgi:hypothetical protein